jgi:hypothetical protein
MNALPLGKEPLALIEISDFHGSEYEDYNLLVYGAM